MAVVNSEYKDRLFYFIFGNEAHKDWTLSLYNAVNHSHHTDVEKLSFNTIREVMYLGMHNDVSFLIDTADLYTEMNLYEEQSSFCPNMPLRKLQYAGNLYEKYLIDHKLNKYGRTLISLPVPKLITFYIGMEKQPDEMILRLSDSFPEGADSDIDVRVRMININPGSSRSILEACQPLMEYSWLIGEIRTNLKNGMTLKQSVDAAIESMPEGNVLKHFLMVNRVEVRTMLLTEYNENEAMELFKEEGRAEGRVEGRAEGRVEGRAEGRVEGRAEGEHSGVLKTLVSLVRQGLISIKDAARESGETEEAFAKRLL